MDICTMAYRPPDLFFGNAGFDQALDIWPLGCVAVELLQRRPLFLHGTEEAGAREYLLLHLKCLGSPAKPFLEFRFSVALPSMC